MPRLTALVRGGSLHPDRLKFLVHATTRNAGVVKADMDPSPASRDRDFRKKLTARDCSKPFLHDAFEPGLVDQVECQLLSREHEQRRGFAVGD